MGIKDTDDRLLCRSMLYDGTCVARGGIVEIVVGRDLELVMAALRAKGVSEEVPDEHVVVRYVDGVVVDVVNYKRAVAAVGFYPFSHATDSLKPMTRAAAWHLSQVRWA